MLCKNRGPETEVAKNEGLCACSGSLALSAQPTDKKEKDSSEKSGTAGITYTEEKNEKTGKTDSSGADGALFGLRSTVKETAGAIRQSPGNSCQSYRIRPERNVYIPIGTSFAGGMTAPHPPEDISSAPGLIYEVAEELYVREKTATELEALCQPPFHKVFDRQQLSGLDLRAGERKDAIITNAAAKDRHEKTDKEEKQHKPLSTASSFGLQLLLMLPVINLIAAMLYSFRRDSEPNRKAFCRAFLIWVTIFLSAALSFFAFCFFIDPVSSSRLVDVLSHLG